ncbi:hypothetical protein [Paratractidigestivibacter sp.]|uniref:hypothetical protein n=1 Tax=Paratractidigestivibacter sp. TaxID=2847316 RepID=UPI002AC98CB9|nr:hypothetical protein [Paratractidigestivibacter sp.]
MSFSSEKRLKLNEGNRIPHFTILLSIAALAIMLFLTASFATDTTAKGGYSSAVIITFAINGALAVVFLCKSIADRPFSLVQMHWIFYITMFVVAPFSQYIYGYSAWGFTLSSSDYFVTNAALLLWGALFAIFSSGRATSAAYEQKIFFGRLPEISARAEVVAVVFAVFATVVVVALVGFENLFTRDTFATDLDKTFGLLFDKALRPLPVFAFVLILARCKQRGKLSLSLFLTLGLMLIACFPAAMARYNMACIYGAVLLLAFAPLFGKKGLFPVLFLLAFLVVFPAANAYRVETFTLSMFGEAIIGAINNLPKGFCAVDYDAYSMVARTLSYVGQYGIAWGYQLLGALFFFVPRAFWATKPDGSGNLVCAAQGQTQLNISSPLPAEGIVNFGIVGLVMFALVAALICRRLDRWFTESDSVLRLFYPFGCLLLFFMMRGDLLSSLAFTVGYAVSFGLLCLVCLGPKVVFENESVTTGGGIAHG